MARRNFAEENLGKAYDARLVKRLLKYAKPYHRLIFLSIVLLMLITAAEVVRPYILQQAIDNHLTNFDSDYVLSKPGQGIEWRGKFLVRQDLTSQTRQTDGAPRYQLVQVKSRYFLLEGEAPPGPVEVLPDGRLKIDGNFYQAWALEKNEVEQLRKEDFQGLRRLALLYLLAISAAFLLNYLQAYVLAYSGQKIIFDIRQELFGHLLSRPISFFDRNPTGRLVTRITNDVETLNEMYTSVLINLFRDVFLLLGIVMVMLKMNWRLALVSFAVIPLIILSTVLYQRYGRAAYRQVRLKLAEVNSRLSEDLTGMKVIQLFNHQRRKWQEFSQINGELLDANLKELKAFAIYRPSMDLIYSLAVALILWYGGGEVIRENLQFGVLYAFISYIQQFFRPINDLTEKYTILQSAMASSERIFALLDNQEEIANPPEPSPLQNVKGKVEFEHVWFAYQPSQWILKDINFTVEPGETVALVGATGSGKSTIINLLSRFYDVQQGCIKLDGIDVRQVSKEDLRRNIGVVLQDVFLFSGDIADNIRLGSKSLSAEEIQRAARHVNADRFIRKLPGGYREEVFERGATLSTGQRQLLAFARALAVNPPVLVLDEATANIDTDTELLIQEALAKLSKNRTTIIIAHRLSTIQHADRIIVLHKGRIREIGKHQELLAQKGMYYKLYNLQFQDHPGFRERG